MFAVRKMFICRGLSYLWLRFVAFRVAGDCVAATRERTLVPNPAHNTYTLKCEEPLR